MKRFLVVVSIIGLLGCAGMTAKQISDTTLLIAQSALGAAQSYYATAKPGFSQDDQAKFEKFLGGFQLAVESGKGVAPFVERWTQFVQGR